MSPAAKAHHAVRLAVKSKHIPPASELACVDCGRPAFGYDHRDYSRPLCVDPVCRPCNALRGPAANHDLGNHEDSPFGRWLKAQERGALSMVARSLGVSTALVAMWAKGIRQVPAHQAQAVAALTGISVKEIRPSDWHLYWPEKPSKKRQKVPA